MVGGKAIQSFGTKLSKNSKSGERGEHDADWCVEDNGKKAELSYKGYEKSTDSLRYEFLHGTDQNVGGFHINGTVSKNKKSDVTYDLNYKWNDKSKIKSDTGFLNGNSGWLKNWSSDWSGKLSERYSTLYGWSEKEQIQPEFGGLNWQ